MNEKIDGLVKYIKSYNEKLYEELAFELYENNQIDEYELEKVLKANNFKLDDNFHNLPLRMKKTYLNHTFTKISFDEKGPLYLTYEIFNTNYFYKLASSSKKNKALTNVLLNYVKEIGTSINILFLGLQYIKINNTKLIQYSAISDYVKKYNINNIYDLMVSLCKKIETDTSKKARSSLKSVMKQEKFLDVDIDDPFIDYALHIESLIDELTKKEANTVKVVFKILDKDHLRTIDYYDDEAHQNKIIKAFKKKVQTKHYYKRLKAYVKDHLKQIESFKPNGYTALYFYLVEEGE